MLNKPKYNLFKNSYYAVEGLIDLIKNEKSFKLQILFFVLFSIIAFCIPIILIGKIILFLSLWLPIIAEIINSAIERVVDLITQDFHDLAKRSKDIGATIVFVSIFFTLTTWILILVNYWQ
jgi:diacylglycerol kinase (ATP)